MSLPFCVFNKDQTIHIVSKWSFFFGFVFIASVQFSTTCLPVKVFLVFYNDGKVWGEVLTFCCVTCSTLRVPPRLSRDSNHIPNSVLVQRLTCEHTHGFNDFTNKNMVSLLTTEQTVCLALLISVRLGPVETLDWVHTWCQCQALVVGNNVVPFPRLRGQSSGVQSAVTASPQSGDRWLVPLQSFQGQPSVSHRLRERAPAPLSLFQSVQDELAGVDESLHTVNEAHFCPRVQLWSWLIHTFLLQRDGVI